METPSHLESIAAAVHDVAAGDTRVTCSLIRTAVVVTKIGFIRQMLGGIATLPLASLAEFLADSRMVAAGESYLRRALEALFDLSRHVLVKGFAVVVTEYKAIPPALLQQGLIREDLADRLIEMAKYRNRLVHYDEEVTPEELYEIFEHHLGDIEEALSAFQAWMADNSELFDDSL